MGLTLLSIKNTLIKLSNFFFRKKVKRQYIYLTVEEVVLFNERVTHIQGQLRDLNSLEGALMRPQMASYYDDADIITQAAILTDGICMAHAFNDGNKRTALLACLTFLEINECKLTKARKQISKEIEVLVAERNLEHFTFWLRKHTKML